MTPKVVRDVMTPGTEGIDERLLADAAVRLHPNDSLEDACRSLHAVGPGSVVPVVDEEVVGVVRRFEVFANRTIEDALGPSPIRWSGRSHRRTR